MVGFGRPGPYQCLCEGKERKKKIVFVVFPGNDAAVSKFRAAGILVQCFEVR